MSHESVKLANMAPGYGVQARKPGAWRKQSANAKVVVCEGSSSSHLLLHVSLMHVSHGYGSEVEGQALL